MDVTFYTVINSSACIVIGRLSIYQKTNIFHDAIDDKFGITTIFHFQQLQRHNINQTFNSQTSHSLTPGAAMYFCEYIGFGKL